MTILTLDPSGHSETGAFYFENFEQGEVFTMTGKNAVEQGKNLRNGLKIKRPDYLAGETSYGGKTNKAHRSLRELVYFNGIIGYLAEEFQIKERQEILNLEVQKVLNYQLERVRKLQEIDSQGFFNNIRITVHERDAILVFYVYGVVKCKRAGPGS